MAMVGPYPMHEAHRRRVGSIKTIGKALGERGI